MAKGGSKCGHPPHWKILDPQNLDGYFNSYSGFKRSTHPSVGEGGTIQNP